MLDSVWSVFKDVEAQQGAQPDGPIVEGSQGSASAGGTVSGEPQGQAPDGQGSDPGAGESPAGNPEGNPAGAGQAPGSAPGTGGGSGEDDGWIKRDRGGASSAQRYETVYDGGNASDSSAPSGTADAVDSLEAELERALEGFDGMILEQRGPVLAQGDRLPEPAKPAEASGGGGAQQASAPSRRPAPLPPEQPRGGQGGGGRVPEDTPSTGPREPVEVPEEFADASDDDVIARQLREAAMAEQDPELREKLWEEYRRYKANGA